MYTSLGSDRDKFREFKKRFFNARKRARHQARNANTIFFRFIEI